MMLREELFSQIGGVNFYNVLSFTLRGERYVIQLEIFHEHIERACVTWYKDDKELHHDSFNTFIKSIDKGIIGSSNPDNIVTWGIFKDKMNLDGILDFTLEKHISFMLGYGVFPGRLMDENKKHFKDITTYLSRGL